MARTNQRARKRKTAEAHEGESAKRARVSEDALGTNDDHDSKVDQLSGQKESVEPSKTTEPRAGAASKVRVDRERELNEASVGYLLAALRDETLALNSEMLKLCEKGSQIMIEQTDRVVHALGHLVDVIHNLSNDLNKDDGSPGRYQRRLQSG